MLQLNHKNLDVWKLSIKLISKIYKITSRYPKEELFSLVNQTRRAAISIAANIAEGSSRKSKAERLRFYEISRSSLVELDTHIEIAIELKYLDDIAIAGLDKDINQLFAKQTVFIEKSK